MDDDKSVLVIGDIMADCYIYGNSERLCPEAPVPVVIKSESSVVPGGAANVAMNISGFGTDTHIMGIIGNDENGKILKDIFKKNKIKFIGVESPSRITTIKERIICRNQIVVRIDSEDRSEIDGETVNQVVEGIMACIDSVKIILVSDYGKGFITKELMREVINIAHIKQIPVLVDPKGKDYNKYYGVDGIKPNEKELADASNIEIIDFYTLKKAADIIMHITGCKWLIVTQGEKGSTLFMSNGKHIHFERRNCDAADVTGAGDVYISTAAYCLINDINIEEACYIANQVSGISVTRHGTTVITKKDIIPFIKVGGIA